MATIQITKKLRITPLIDIQSTAFAEQYEHGVWWSMHGDEQGKGPMPASYLVTNLRQYEEHNTFHTSDPYYLHHIGFFIGMYHGGILSPQTGQLRPNVTALALLDHKDAIRGYRIGREACFHEPGPVYRYTEYGLIERLQDLVRDNLYNERDNATTWYYGIGCLLGGLSGQVFPETRQERQTWEEEYGKWATRKVQEARVLQRSAILQET